MDGQRASKRRRTSAGGSPSPSPRTCLTSPKTEVWVLASSPGAVAAAAASEVEDDEAFAQRLQEEENARYERERAEVQRRAAEWRRGPRPHGVQRRAGGGGRRRRGRRRRRRRKRGDARGRPRRRRVARGGSRRERDGGARSSDGDAPFLRRRHGTSTLRVKPWPTAGLARSQPSRSPRTTTSDCWRSITPPCAAVFCHRADRIPRRRGAARRRYPLQEANERGGTTRGCRRRRSESIAPPLAEEHSRCAVCLEQYTVGDRVRHLPCLHSYHQSCIDRWLSASVECPVCREDVNALMD